MEIPKYPAQPPYPEEIFHRRYRVQGRHREAAFKPHCRKMPSIDEDCDCNLCLSNVIIYYVKEDTPPSKPEAQTPEEVPEVTPLPEPDVQTPEEVPEVTPPPEPDVQTPEEVPEVTPPPEPDVQTPEEVPDPTQWRPEGHHSECTCESCNTALLNAAPVMLRTLGESLLKHLFKPATTPKSTPVTTTASPSQETPVKTTTMDVPQTSTPVPRPDIPPLDPYLSEELVATAELTGENAEPPNMEVPTDSQTPNLAALHDA
ncbi:proteoglycan 4-like [Palaemon carinicauda]|uniref:proteoglycan 4-like n=1 Tax=Palaemon carinicauda TaxID=392227 RepID=UPI0035B5E5DB